MKIKYSVEDSSISIRPYVDPTEIVQLTSGEVVELRVQDLLPNLRDGSELLERGIEIVAEEEKVEDPKVKAKRLKAEAEAQAKLDAENAQIKADQEKAEAEALRLSQIPLEGDK